MRLRPHFRVSSCQHNNAVISIHFCEPDTETAISSVCSPPQIRKEAGRPFQHAMRMQGGEPKPEQTVAVGNRRIAGRQCQHAPFRQTVPPRWVVLTSPPVGYRNNMGGTACRDPKLGQAARKNHGVVPKTGRVRLQAAASVPTASKQPQHGPEAWLWNA